EPRRGPRATPRRSSSIPQRTSRHPCRPSDRGTPMRYLIAALLLAPAAAFAGGYAIPNEDPRDLALSQSTVAAQTGPEAAHTNPAALAGQQGLAATVSGEMIYNRTTWSDPALSQAASLQPKANFPPQVAIAYGNSLPNGMAYGVGWSLLVPGGGSLEWPTGWAGAGRIQNVTQRAWLNEVSAALQPHPLVKIGASFLYYQVTEELSQQVLPGTVGRLGLAGGGPSFGVSGEFHAPADIP